MTTASLSSARRAAATAFSIIAFALAFAPPAAAQASRFGMPTRAPRFEISGGGFLVGGFDLGENAAELTPNTGSDDSSEFFTTDSRVKPAFGVLGRLSFLVTPSFAIEGSVRFAKPVFEVELTDDIEDAPDVTAEETITQYVFDASAVWYFSGNGRGRMLPFVYGGAGYLRELHEEDTLVEDGVEYHGGGGVKWRLGSHFGLRAEAGISIRDGGFDFEEKKRIVPVVAGTLVYAF